MLCATKRSLPELVREGRFREDLYYRIGAVSVVVPPLRERRDDVVPLAEHFVGEWCGSRGRPRAELGDAVLDRLLRHDWPGNVRELRHAVEHALAFSSGGALRPEHLPSGLGESGPPPLLELHLEARTCRWTVVPRFPTLTGDRRAEPAEVIDRISVPGFGAVGAPSPKG